MKRTQGTATPKLALSRETLLRLDSEKLEWVAGGATSTSLLCPTITSVQCLVFSGDCRQ